MKKELNCAEKLLALYIKHHKKIQTKNKKGKTK